MNASEKFALSTFILFVALTVAGSVFLVNAVEDAGGLRAVVVEAGKCVKDIFNEIMDDSEGWNE